MYIGSGRTKDGHSSYMVHHEHNYPSVPTSPKQPEYGRGCFFAGNDLVEYALGSQTQDSGKDNIEALLQGKRELLRSKINLLLIQLEKRKQVNQEVTSRIEQDDCYVGSMIMQTAEPGEKLGLEKVRLDLEKQKRMESVNYFRDTSLLNTELKDTLLEYQKEKQNEGLFTENNQGGLQ